MRDSKRKVVIKVFKALEGAGGWIWVRELARRTKLHPEQVRRVLDDELREAVEEMCLAIKLRPVRLKQGVTLKGHLRYLRLMKRL